MPRTSRRTGAIVVAATALGLLLRLYQLTRPGLLHGVPNYDDGEYLGSAIRLAGGALPYRDFAFVQPPGITVLMLPMALIGKATSTATAMVVVRVLMAFVGAAGIALLGLLLRHRGPLATVLGCGILAVHPDAVNSASTLFLEPWLVLFCLLGALALFDADELTGDPRRALWGGIAFGFAGAIKVWAVFPAAALLALSARRRAGLGARYAAGLAVGFCLPVIPFAALAPKRFFDSVILAQLHQNDVVHVPVTSRLASLFGLGDLGLGSHGVVALAVLIVVLIAATALAPRAVPPALESFALSAAVITLIAFMLPTEYFPHYAGFFAPFLALSVALPLSRLAGVALPARMPAISAATALAALAFVALGAVRFSSARSLRASTPPASLRARIPAGACVVTDEASFTILADRFISTVPGCSTMVDSTATDMALSDGRNGLTGAGRYPAVQSAWLAAFRHAGYVWLNCAPPRARPCDRFTNRRIPWTGPILSYFTGHFRRVGPFAPGILYVRAGR